jgi:hypothetical protein
MKPLIISIGTVISDMGCGDAELSQTLAKSNPLIIVHSFDLVSQNAYVTACDVKNVRVFHIIYDRIGSVSEWYR